MNTIEFNKPLKMDAESLLSQLDDGTATICFFDPQYRGVLDKLKFGNEGKSKEKRRCELKQMSEETIINIIKGIDKALKPSGYLFLWIDKFHLCEGVSSWFKDTNFQIVDLMVWEKGNIGMGYRLRNKCEFLLILQKAPLRAKDTWFNHSTPNVWKESVNKKLHPHAKPIDLQVRLIKSTTKVGDIVLDPAMGSGSVLTACKNCDRMFIGCDLNPVGVEDTNE